MRLDSRAARTLLFTCAIVAAALAVPRPARADAAKDACFDAYEQSQHLRKKGQLRAAQVQLQRCAKSECPGFVANDCAQWSRDVEVSLPTAIFVAKDQHGQDLIDVSVAVDNQEVQSRIDGRPIPLDPGAHTVRYKGDGKTIEVSIVLAEGEKGRRVEALFAGKETAPNAATTPETAERRRAPIPTASYVLAGIGAIAAVSFVGFGIAGKGKESCAPHCVQADVDSLRRDYLIADISWIAGLVAIGAGITWWLVQPAPRTAAAASASSDELKLQSLKLFLQPMHGGGAIGTAATF